MGVGGYIHPCIEDITGLLFTHGLDPVIHECKDCKSFLHSPPPAVLSDHRMVYYQDCGTHMEKQPHG